ncbi:MAG: EAL domain-containing protein [Alphaproteobacteria bacterium]
MSTKSPGRHTLRHLTDRLNRLKNRSDTWTLFLLDFRYTPFAASAIQTEMAIHLLRQGLQERDGECYLIGAHFLACLTDARTAGVLHELISEMMTLTGWAEAALLANRSGGAFITRADVRQQATEIETILTRLGAFVAATEAPAPPTVENKPAWGQAKPEERKASALTPLVQLEFIESQLVKLRFPEVLRAQPICQIKENVITTFIGQEIYTSIGFLQKQFTTEIDMMDFYLLRHHLSQRLDQLLIAEFDDDRLLAPVFAIHVNVMLSTLRSPAFQHLDSLLAGRSRRITLEVNITDALAHIEDYLAMVPVLQKRGYRVALDGLSTASLGVIDVQRLPADMIKLIWQDDMSLVGTAADRLRTLRRRGARILLCRCDHSSAFTWGAANGIAGYQGVAVDTLAANTLHGICQTGPSRKCTTSRCQTVHWAFNQARSARCPRPMWIVPKAATTALPPTAATGSVPAAGPVSVS